MVAVPCFRGEHMGWVQTSQLLEVVFAVTNGELFPAVPLCRLQWVCCVAQSHGQSFVTQEHLLEGPKNSSFSFTPCAKESSVNSLSVLLRENVMLRWTDVAKQNTAELW